MAVWRRKPKNNLLFYSGQRSRFTSINRAELSHPPTIPSLRRARRGNCLENTVSGPFQLALARTDHAQTSPDQRIRQTGRVRLRRNALQPEAQTCEVPDAVARRVRTATKEETRRRLGNLGHLPVNRTVFVHAGPTALTVLSRDLGDQHIIDHLTKHRPRLFQQGFAEDNKI